MSTSKYIRLVSMTIDNLKNIEHGRINFINTRKDYKSSLLGIYGQNGSGKTALIDAISILKLLLTGQKLPSTICDYINISSASHTCELNFELLIEDNHKHILVDYEVELGITSSIMGGSNITDDTSDRENQICITKERLQYKIESVDTNIRKSILIDTDVPAKQIFKPKSKLDLLVGRDMDDITDLIVNKKQAKAESRSFIFSPEFMKRLYIRNKLMSSNKNFELMYSILTDLVKYGNHDLFVVTTEHSGLISLDALPLEINYRADTRHIVGTIGLSLNQPNVFPVAVVQDIRDSIAMMNLVLNQIIPGLTIGVETLGKEKLQDNQDGERFELVSYKSNTYIPLKYESEGIRKIISVLGLLISVYNRKSITVAIDELDSGIFEYLLGEILRIISEKGEGQLIFTSHNLRPLETLDKGCIAFTTTNPSNRYTRMVNVKTSNNLRDFYYRDIMLGEQNEELYKSTNNAEISYAFRKAGAYKWHDEK